MNDQKVWAELCVHSDHLGKGRHHYFYTKKKCHSNVPPERACSDLTSKIERSGIFSTGPQRTNLSLQTGLGSTGCSGAEKTKFSDGGG